MLVLDEAHEAPDVMAAALGVTLTPGRVAAVARLASANEVARHRDRLDRVLEPLVGTRLRDGPAGEASVGEALTDLAQAVRTDRSALRSQPSSPKRDRATKALDSLAADIETILQADDDDVTWVEQSRSRPALRVAPIDVGAELARVAWSAATPILTSATIPLGLGAQLGLDPDRVELDVGSPFDYRQRALPLRPPPARPPPPRP